MLVGGLMDWWVVGCLTLKDSVLYDDRERQQQPPIYNYIDNYDKVNPDKYMYKLFKGYTVVLIC